MGILRRVAMEMRRYLGGRLRTARIHHAFTPSRPEPMRRVYRPTGPAAARLAAVLLPLALAAVPGQALAAIAFEDVTRRALDRQADSDYRFDAVWTDFNGDGCPDPFVFGHADPATSRLWLNLCDGSGSFRLVGNDEVRHYINPPVLPLGAGWMTVLDVDGDGREDFWLRHANMMAGWYRNGSAAGAFVPRFEDKHEACDDPCVFADVDGDGRLDRIHPDRRVVDIASGRQLHPPARTRGEAIVVDLDGDGWPDIAQPAAGGWWRNRDGRLDWVDAGLRGDRPLLAADLDRDGHLDLLTLTDAGEAGDGRLHLLRNDGRGRFAEVTADSGLAALPVQRWHAEYGNALAGDLDNDGWPDLVLTSLERRQPVLVFRNEGGLRFRRVDIDLGASGRGSEGHAARADLADYDLDGRLDLVKTQAVSNLGLWRNTAAPVGRWMQLRLRGPAGNRDAVGAHASWYAAGTGELLAHTAVQVGPGHPPRVLHAGLGDAARVDLVVRWPHGGPAWRFDGLATRQALVAYPDGCLLEGWRPGAGWPLAAPAQCPRRGVPVTGDLPAGTRPGADPQAGGAGLAALAAAVRLAAPAADPAAAGGRITLRRHGATASTVTATFGIPLPPGALDDPRALRILDEEGSELPARVTPTLRWHFRDDSLRAVRVQVRVELPGAERTLRFALGQPRATADPEPVPYADGLVDGGSGVRVPGVLALLEPAWLSASGIAGPLLPVGRDSRAYDAYFARQFEWAGALPSEDPIAFLFDRASTLYKHYVRSGDPAHLAAAIESHRFYMGKLVRGRDPENPQCTGGWKFGRVNPCDVKFVYIEPILLHLALTGDDTLHDEALVEAMASLWDRGGWSGIRGPYLRADQDFTERQAGLGLLALVKAWELTGDARYRRSVEERIGWLHDHQRGNPDGLGDDGCWRHSWQRHEGSDYDPASDVRGCSPWMSENIVDGLWQAWLATGDPRIPAMLTGFGRWLEAHGWIGEEAFRQAGHSWRDPCSGPRGQIAWYFGSSQAGLDDLIAIQDSEGWYSDAHTVQLALPVALARFFESDPEQARALERRLDLVAHSWATACAASAATPRRFNWNNRGSGVVQWLRRNFPVPGEAPQDPAALDASR